MKHSSKTYMLVDGFDEGVLLYVLPILVAYSARAEINEIIFYKTDLKFLKNHYVNLGLESRYPVRIRNYHLSDSLKLLSYNKRNFFDKLVAIFKICPRFFSFDRREWREVRDSESDFIYHSLVGFWDLLFKTHGQKTIVFDWKQRASVGNRILKSMILSCVISRHDCVCVFLGHNVYQTKVLAAAAIKEKKAFFLHAAFCIRQMTSFEDPPPPELTDADLKRSFESIPDSEARQIFEERFSSRSSNLDAARFWRYKKTFESVPPPSNLVTIFLPVLRDSAFGWENHERAYFDYIDWLIKVTEHLKRLGMPVIYRCHPASKSWGENTQEILELYNICETPNLVWIDDGERFDPKELIRNSRYLLSYKGTIAAESAALGVKSIVFDRTSLTKYFPELVSYIESDEQFCELLTAEPRKVSELDRVKAMKLLLARERSVSFVDRLNSEEIFAGQSQSEKLNYKAKLEVSVKQNLEFLIAEGERLFEQKG